MRVDQPTAAPNGSASAIDTLRSDPIVELLKHPPDPIPLCHPLRSQTFKGH
jgi:hypothetical protein